MNLQHKRAVLTGASGGIGRAMMAALQEAGAYVVACDLPGSDLQADEVVEFDISNPQATEAAAALIAKDPIDILISNAGGTRVDLMEHTDTDAILSDLRLNYSGAAILSRALLPAMRGRPDGAAIVFVASVNGLSHFGSPAYSAAKAGVIAWAKALATEEGKHGVRANVVAPGSVHTAAWDERKAGQPDIFDKVAGLYPLGRLVTPQEVANAAMFLASSAASGITGTVLPVDAGLTGGNLPFIDIISS